jgi:putative SOS response-associated peptidase YedK
MCGRYSFSNNLDRLASTLKVDRLPMTPRGSVLPLSGAPVVVQRQGEKPRIETMQWGLIPWWSHDDTGAADMVSAPTESITDTSALRYSFHQRRCLVIADAFYAGKNGNEAAQTWRFSFSGEQGPMMMAGIWDSWRPLGAPAPRYTFCVLTVSASPSVSAIQDRMPMIVPESAWSLWLNPQTPVETLSPLLQCWPDPLLAEAWPHGTEHDGW